MSSGYPGGHPDYFNINTNTNTNNLSGRSVSMMNLNNNRQSALAGILSDTSLRRPDMIGKRSLAEFQHQQHIQQQAAFFLRNVKQRPFNNTSSFSSEISSLSNTPSFSSVPRYGVPVMQNFNFGNRNFNGVMGNYLTNNNNRVSLPNLTLKQTPLVQETTDVKMMKQLQELEKQLLLDDELDGGENDVVSGVTNSEWSETLFTPPEINIVSPTTSSSSSCASSSASPATSVSSNQLLSDVAAAITDGKSDTAMEILTRLTHVSNAHGTSEQRLCSYMTAALRSRLKLTPTPAAELYGKDHILSTQLLYDKSPIFKLGFMAANSAILELIQTEKKIHVLDFDIGQGVQYVYMLHEIASAREARVDGEKQTPFSINLSTLSDFGNGGVERLKLVGDNLQNLAKKLGVLFSFNVLSLNISDLNTTSLKVESGDVLVVNFAFKLYKLPDESVTTENLRDEVLRRVKGLSPVLVTVVEQELNGNTASFETRVNHASGYYGALLESLDATIGRDNSDRVKIEEGLSRKLMNSVACEGRDRVERCEVFGKWRARMSMAGFEPKVVSQLSVESLSSKVNSVTRGNPGFTATEDAAGGIGFGWNGRTLTVASTWH